MYKIKVNDKYTFQTERGADRQLKVNGTDVAADICPLNDSSYHVIHQLSSYNAEVVGFDAKEKTAEVKVNGNLYTISVQDQFDLLLDQLGLSNLNAAKVSEIKAPMPGLVLKVFVNEGDEVKKGDNLFTLEAMKMENIIKAPADVTIKTIKITAGDKVEKNQVLMLFA